MIFRDKAKVIARHRAAPMGQGGTSDLRALSLRSFSMRHLFLRLLAVGLVGALAACSPAPRATGIHDPHEASNRRTHEFNRKIDSKLLRPAGTSYAKVVPEPVVQGVGNFSSNLATPGLVVNNMLQGDAEGAFVNSWRFVLNSTIGILGLVDAAQMLGLEEHSTDFGETLHVWGAEEGAYVELPGLGPSTERDAVGKFVDLFLNPLGYILPKPERFAIPVASGLAKVGDRGRYSQLVDSVLYESADSYAQGRVTYLQNRRYKLSGGSDLDDPYSDPYGDDYGDPYDEILSD